MRECAMRHALALLFCLMLTPAHAEEAEDGFDLFEEGAKLMLRGLAAEMEPALRDMDQALRDLEPAARKLITLLGDLRNYHEPEVLPNGDILIRRKTPAELALPKGPQTEL